jgi:hypothetical protein
MDNPTLHKLLDATDNQAKIQSFENFQHSNDDMLNNDIAKNQEDWIRLKRVVDHLPQVSEKLAFIKQLQNEKGTLNAKVNYVEWFSGDAADKAAKEDHAGAPTDGYYIRNRQIEDRFEIPKDVLIYMLNSELQFELMNFTDFANNNDSMRERLVQFHFVGNKLVYLEEKYRP